MLVYLKLGGVVLAALILGFGGGYIKGRSDGAEIGRTATLQQSVNNLRERKAGDEAIRNMDDARLCASIGGVFQDGECQ